ncbi:MAG: large conductance mechanosensitive channel protein MscL, partial [Gemmiger sp.]
MKKFLEEFKAFALKGNVMDMAIGVIIGGAFQTIVSALTESLINPLIGLLFQMNLDGVGLTLAFGDKTVFFGFGAFVSAVINFLILAFVLFCLLKAVHRMMELGKKKEEPAPAKPAGPTQE